MTGIERSRRLLDSAIAWRERAETAEAENAKLRLLLEASQSECKRLLEWKASRQATWQRTINTPGERREDRCEEDK